MTPLDLGTPYSRVSAGLLGYIGGVLPHDRILAAVGIAPWRGLPGALGTIVGGRLAALGRSVVCRDGAVTVALHGRIDNLDELSSRFHTPGNEPGPALMAAYRQFGAEVARHLTGDFALLVLDGDRGTLLGARDWIGARPLFWGQHQGVTAFGSEVKQVLALLNLPHVTDEAALRTYASGDAPAPDATFARDVRAVMPNGQVLATLGGSAHVSVAPVRFEPVQAGVEEAIDETRRLLANAVRRRIAGSQCMATMISGGMDSTSVAVMAAHIKRTECGPEVFVGLTLTYPDFPRCDESDYARAVAELAGISWVPVPISPGLLRAGVPGNIELHDGPIFPSVGAEYLVDRAADFGVDVLLSGRLGDHWLDHRRYEVEFALLRGEWGAAARAFTRIVRRSPRRAARSLLRAAKHQVQRRRAEEVFEARVNHYMTRTAVEVEEREGMRHGLQVVCPFGDEELARYLVGLPASVKAYGLSPKGVLRAAMTDLLPESVIARTSKTKFDDVVAAALRPAGREDVSLVDAAFGHYARAYRDAFRATGNR